MQVVAPVSPCTPGVQGSAHLAEAEAWRCGL